MGLPISKLVVATNENDILDRFFRTGRYEKQPFSRAQGQGGDLVEPVEEGVKETLSPAMDILMSSNFERLLWYLAKECAAPDTSEGRKSEKASIVVKEWMECVKSHGGIVVSDDVLKAAQRDFQSFRVSDNEAHTPDNPWLTLDSCHDCGYLRCEEVYIRPPFSSRCLCCHQVCSK